MPLQLHEDRRQKVGDGAGCAVEQWKVLAVEIVHGVMTPATFDHIAVFEYDLHAAFSLSFFSVAGSAAAGFAGFFPFLPGAAGSVPSGFGELGCMGCWPSGMNPFIGENMPN